MGELVELHHKTVHTQIQKKEALVSSVLPSFVCELFYDEDEDSHVWAESLKKGPRDTCLRPL